jgi:hypothetical protein
MHIVRTHHRTLSVASAAERRTVRRAPRHAALTVVLAALILLLLASAAQAYAPGQLIWAKHVGSSTSEAGALAVARGPNGAVAMAGYQVIGPAGRLPMVAKYTAAGRKWVMTYAASGTAEAVTFDRAGNVYVAATVGPASGSDIVVIKYSAAGDLKWTTAPYDFGTHDRAQVITVDKSGNVIVLGSSDSHWGYGPDLEMTLLKYDASGALAWPAAHYDPVGTVPDAYGFRPSDVAVGGSGDIYVSGSTFYLLNGQVWSGTVLKFAGADGYRLARWTYKPLGAPDSQFHDIAVRGSAVVAVGETYDHEGVIFGDGLVARFDLSLQQQYRKEWAVAGMHAWFNQAVIDGNGNVYVTGKQWVSGTGGYDRVVTMKLDPTLATVVWKGTYLPKSRHAEGLYIARDGAGYIFVSGVKRTSDTTGDFLTMKYGPSGTRKWLKTWSGAGPGVDSPCGLVLGVKSDVFVAGEAATSDYSDTQAALLRYQR